MTIASEITRLQWAKADICSAIEWKWVTVWNISIDQYCDCIKAISWHVYWYVDLLVVWWWGGWSRATDCFAWWWWGAGWFIYSHCLPISENVESCPVSVGAWWAMNCNWCPTYFWNSTPWSEFYAYWWGAWWAYSTACNGWSWWGWGWWRCTNGWTGTAWQWNKGGTWCYSYWWWWWGWANLQGRDSTYACRWWDGWAALANYISGGLVYYAWWWGGGTSRCCTSSTPWWSGGSGAWWDGGTCGHRWRNAVTYWSWWGGGWWWTSNYCWWAWCQWVVYIRYHTDWSDWIKPTSTWGTRYNCGVYTIHRFTNTSSVEYFHPVFS